MAGYNNTVQSRIQKRIDSNNEMMKTLCGQMVVKKADQAKKLLKGIKAFSGLDPDKQKEMRKDMQAKSVKEVVKTIGNGDIAAAAMLIDKGMKRVDDAFLGQLQQDVLAPSNKTLYGDGTSSAERATVTILTGLQSADDVDFDMSWTQAFSAVDATNADFIKRNDIVHAARFFEQTSRTDKVKYNQIGGKQDDVFSYTPFAGGVEYHLRDNRFSMFTANTLINSLQVASVMSTTRHAMRVLFAIDDNSVKLNNTKLKVKGFTGGTTDIEKLHETIIRRRKTLNAAHHYLIKEAKQIQPDNQSKKKRPNESPIEGLSADTVMLLYVSPDWFEQIDEIMSYRIPANTGVATNLLRRFAFIPTYHAPTSGALRINAVKSEAHDDHGFLNHVTEEDGKGNMGGMLIIPGRGNNHGIFRRTTFFSDRGDSAEESIKIAAKNENGFVKDQRQYAWLDLGKYNV